MPSWGSDAATAGALARTDAPRAPAAQWQRQQCRGCVLASRPAAGRSEKRRFG